MMGFVVFINLKTIQTFDLFSFEFGLKNAYIAFENTGKVPSDHSRFTQGGTGF